MRKLSCFIFITFILISCNNQNKKNAESFFYAANDRLKNVPEKIDSIIINQCISDYTNAIKLNPKFWQAYRNRAGLYADIKQFKKAINDLTTALQYADKNSAINLHDMRAYSYYGLQYYDKAIQDWTIAVDNLANPSFALLQRAKARWMSGHKAKACEDYKKVVQLDKTLDEKKEFLKCE